MVCAAVSAVVRVCVYVRTSARPAEICIAPPVSVVVGAPMVVTVHPMASGAHHGSHVM